MIFRVVDKHGQVREFRSWMGAARAAVQLHAAGRRRRYLIGYDEKTGRAKYGYSVEPGVWDGVACLHVAPGCRFELVGLQSGRKS